MTASRRALCRSCGRSFLTSSPEAAIACPLLACQEWAEEYARALAEGREPPPDFADPHARPGRGAPLVDLDPTA